MAATAAHGLKYGHVLVAVGDGAFQGTSAVASLTQLLVDPWYRTVAGFQVLVAKDWTRMPGSMMPTRAARVTNGELRATPTHFFLFLDCVHQLLRRFPTAFEFSDAYLRAIGRECVSSRYKTFLVDTDGGCRNPTTDDDLWTALRAQHHAQPLFFNFDYSMVRPVCRHNAFS